MSRKKLRRRRGLGSIDTSSLSCSVAVGNNASAEIKQPNGRLTEAQCSRFPAGKLLGQGHYGSVFEHAFDPTKVVKFTVDEADAQNSRTLIGKHSKGSVNIFDVAQLNNVEGGYCIEDECNRLDSIPKDVFAIVAEKVNPLPEDFESGWRTIGSAVRNALSYDGNRYWAKMVRDNDFELPKEVYEYAYENCYETKRKRVPKGLYPTVCKGRINKLIKQYKELTKLGVGSWDLDIRNWGMRNGEPVLMDLGSGFSIPDGRSIDLAGMKRPKRVASKNKTSSRKYRRK